MKHRFRGMREKLWNDDEFNSRLDAMIRFEKRDECFSEMERNARDVLATMPVQFRTGTKPLHVVTTLINAADRMYCEERGHRSIITWPLLSRLTGLADSKLCQNSAAKLYNEARRVGLV